MTLIHHPTPRSVLTDPAPRRRSWREFAGLGAAVLVVGLVAYPVLTEPPPPTEAEVLAAYIEEQSQTLRVSSQTTSTAVTRDSFTASPGIATLAAGGTNHDWAKLVMLLAGWPQTESNITVFTRWMRQENGPDDWWNRNNPLNNGWGSGGGGGLGSYDTPDHGRRERRRGAARERRLRGDRGRVRRVGTDRGHRGRDLGFPMGDRPLRRRRALVVHAGAGHPGATGGLGLETVGRHDGRRCSTVTPYCSANR